DLHVAGNAERDRRSRATADGHIERRGWFARRLVRKRRDRLVRGGHRSVWPGLRPMARVLVDEEGPPPGQRVASPGEDDEPAVMGLVGVVILEDRPFARGAEPPGGGERHADVHAGAGTFPQ